MVSKLTELLNLEGSEFSGNMKFAVRNKNDINLSGCQFTTAQCDYILNQIIANGAVTGTHTIDFTSTLQAPTPSKVADAEVLGWTVVGASSIAVGDLYGGGTVLFVDGTQILIGLDDETANHELLIEQDISFAAYDGILAAYNAGAINGYDDWRLPTETEGLLLIENAVEKIIVDGMNSAVAYLKLWWSSTSPVLDTHQCLNWDGSQTSTDPQEDVNLNNGFAIRKITL